MHRRAASVYRKVHIESASNARILDELFVSLLRDLDEAERLIGARDAAGKGAAINHGLAILSTLPQGLSRDAAPALCDDLARLYDFATGRLVAANLRFDATPLQDARRVLGPLRDAFGAAIAAAPLRP